MSTHTYQIRLKYLPGLINLEHFIAMAIWACTIKLFTIVIATTVMKYCSYTSISLTL